MSHITDMVDPFDGELSNLGYKLGNIYGFDLDIIKLQELINNTVGNTIRVGFNARIPDLTLRELSPDKLRLAIKLVQKMHKAQDNSVMGLIKLNETYSDIVKIGEKLNDYRWMDK